MVRPRTFFDISIAQEPAGRIVFELFNDIVPKTCENFRALCTGELGTSKISDVPLHYRGSTFHRLIAQFMIQGGDFTRGNGKGGESIYGDPFEDEDLSREVDAEGLLVMANKGPDTNGSQWFITLRPCPHLNGKHVVFGRVVSGYELAVRISKLPVDGKDRPLQPVVISHCGELELRKTAPKVAPPLPRSVSPSSKSPSRSKRRHSISSRGSYESDEDRDHERRKSKHKSHKKDNDGHRDRSSKHKSKKSRRSPSADDSGRDRRREKESRQETEAELDARLEREEKERLAEERRRKVEEMKRRAPVGTSSNGINYKGRGRMKFRDPEATDGW
ncbi:hypothetical protein FRB99_005851 [Tulasnella sp. 403]|nr:hypothetical protein FRB99_005851 [Tulasnella sp. 403]